MAKFFRDLTSLRVLFVTINTHPFSGSAMQMLHLLYGLRGLVKKSHLVLAPDSQSEYNRQIAKWGPSYITVSDYNDIPDLADTFEADIVHAHIESIPKLVELLPNTPIIANYGSSEPISEALAASLEFPNVRAVISVSRGGAECICSMYPKLARKVCVIRQSTVAEELSDLLNSIIPNLRLNFEDKFGLIILRIGAVRNYKDPVTFITAVDHVRQYHPEATGLWVGPVSPARVAAVARLSRSTIDDLLGFPRIRGTVFCGASTNVSSIIQSANVVVSTSVEYEGIPGCIREGMYFGVPVVTTDVGYVSELVINEWNGHVVPPRDETAMSNAIIAAINRGPKIEAQTKCGMKYVKLFFSLRLRVQRHLSLYLRIMEEGI